MARRCKEMNDLRIRFDQTGRSVAKYARAYELDKTTLSKVLSRELTGVRRREGNTKKCIMQLKKDGIWIDPLPWERAS